MSDRCGGSHFAIASWQIFGQAAECSPQEKVCPTSYAPKDGILSNYGHCSDSAHQRYCLLPKEKALAFCENNAGCDGISETSNARWKRAYPGLVMLGKLGLTANSEWATCEKEKR